MNQSHLRGMLATVAKALVSAGLIAFALRDVDSRMVLEQLRNAEQGAVTFAAFVTLAISVLHARRWEVVLRRMEHALPFSETLRLVLIGYFFNQTLPSTVGGDAYRAWGAYRRGIHAGNAVASVVVDRVFALVALVIMIAGGAWWLFRLLAAPMAQWAIVAVCAATPFGFGVLIALPRFARFLRRWRVTRVMLQVSEGARAVITSARAVAEVLLLTIAGHAILSYAVYLLAGALGVELSLGYALLLMPLVTLITLLPVAIAGWGLRESAMVVSLGLIGVPSVQAFSLSVLLGLVVMASGLPGGILWLLSQRRKPQAVRPTGQPEGTR